MKVSVTKEAVSLLEQSVISQGDYAINECTFDLPDCFEGLNVTAVFNNIPVPVTEGKCIIPSLKKGNGVLGVYAYKKGGDENAVELMYSPKPCMFWVGEGSYSEEISVENVPDISEFEEYCNGVSAYYEANLKAFSELVKGCESQENRRNEINELSTDEEYPTAKAVFKAIKPVKKLLSAGSGVNLFNKNSSEIEEGWYISSDENKYEASIDFITHPISVAAGQTYTTLWNPSKLGTEPRIWMYTDKDSPEDKNFIIRLSALGNVDEWIPITFTITNESVRYIRFNSCISMKDVLMVIEGDTYPEEYQEYGVSLNTDVKIPQLKDYIHIDEVESYIPYEDISELQGNVICLENGVIFPEWEIGRISSSTGLDVSGTNGIRTDFIELQKYGSLKVSKDGSVTVYLIEYDEEKKYLGSSNTQGNTTILSPQKDGCKYVRISTYKKDDNLTDTSGHSQYVSVYYDEFSIKYLNEKTTELSEKIDKNRIRSSYAFDNTLLKSINHRGFNTVAPENTPPAYRLSKRKGFQFVECDVVPTSDKVLVLLHDDTINRTARNADGSEIAETININDITYEQALSYDFGIWKGEAYAGTKIPTFEEFIVLCRDLGLYPYIEIKDHNYGTDEEPVYMLTQEDVNNIVSIVHKYGLERCATYVGNHRSVLQMVINSDKTARVGMSFSGNITDYNCKTEKSYLDTGVNEFFIALSLQYATEENITVCTDNGIPVEVYSPNTEEAILALDKRISGVTSDMLIAEEIIRNNNLGNAETGLIE